ncbi:hypothetical protein BDZ89DRAFT_506836 [Hymenopellis radicata]|nr:hypothetical protein BDZ89DRAFT_506836 [Hymenopellis radicata]
MNALILPCRCPDARPPRLRPGRNTVLVLGRLTGCRRCSATIRRYISSGTLSARSTSLASRILCRAPEAPRLPCISLLGRLKLLFKARRRRRPCLWPRWTRLRVRRDHFWEECTTGVVSCLGFGFLYGHRVKPKSRSPFIDISSSIRDTSLFLSRTPPLRPTSTSS